MNQLAEISTHPFPLEVLKAADRLRKTLVDSSPLTTQPHFVRDPDEHEFYLLRTSSYLVEVVNCCQQLAHIPIYLSNHKKTSAMGKAGINRHSAIVYHVENYIVRTQSLLDRVLKLIDAVFHLTNDPRNCRYDVIVRNVKVQVSDIVDSVKHLKRLTDRYSQPRNQIVHHSQFDEDALRRLEFYFLSERWEQVSPTGLAAGIRQQIQDHIHEILWFKKKEFLGFNKEIGAAITQIFDKLRPYYAREEGALRLRLSKDSRPSN